MANRKITPHEAKRYVHEIEYAKSRSFYAEQNLRAEAEAIYKAQDKAYREHEARMREAERRKNQPKSDPMPFYGVVVVSVLFAFLFSLLNLGVGFNDAPFLVNWFWASIIFFVICFFQNYFG